jgi:hypothetical protein
MTAGASRTGVKVLYIVAGTRSGSTLLDRLLGSMDGYFSSGELRYLWERGLIEGRRCGCGSHVSECPVWSKVLQVDLGDGPVTTRMPADVVAMQRATLRTRHTWRVLRARREELTGTMLGRTAEIAERLYRAVAAVTGTRVVVDSSKLPSDGALLRLMPRIDPYVVHLVRDPRAVAFSWQRRKTEHDRQTAAEMPRWSVTSTGINWLAVNAASEALLAHMGKGRRLRVRYEDFVQRPREVVERIAAMVGEPKAELPFTGMHTALIAPNHTVSGNPDRFTSGPVTLRSDDEWTHALAPAGRLITTGLALPLLPRYRYPVRSGRSARPA